MLTKKHACFCMYCFRKKRFFFEKNLKMAGDPKYFLRKFVQLNLFLRRSKKIGVFMFKIPDFSLAPRQGKHAGLDLVSA